MRLGPKSRGVFGVMIAAFLLAAFSVLIVWAATFTDDSQVEFDVGTYSSTEWGVDHVQLTSGSTSGTFTSQVFDATTSANWSQIAWSETLTSVDKLIVVDVAADIWKSVNNGAAWSLVKDDYNGTDANNATDMVIDGNGNLWVLNNQDVWKSADKGLTWTKINDDYNGGEGQNGVRIARDSGNNLYIAEADEDVWYSADGGATWTKQAININGGSGNIGGFVGIGSSLYAVDAAADVWKSVNGGVTWSLLKDDYNGTDGNGVSYTTASGGGNLYTVFNQDIWKSSDAGTSWTKINDDYNGSESQSAIVMAINSSGHLFIAEADEDIWRSADEGATWAKQGVNINGGNGNIVGMGYITVTTDITFAVRAGSTNPPTDSFSGAYTVPGGSSITVADNRYFQYQATFISGDSNVSPELSSVTVTYALPTSTPTPTPTPSETPTPTPTSSETPTPTPSEPPPVIEVIAGGEGGAGSPAKIIFSGETFPGAKIGMHLLGKEYGDILVGEFVVGRDGKFEKETISPVQEERLYSLFITDRDGNIGKAKFFTYSLKYNTIVRQQNIIFAPLMNINKKKISRGGLLFISGLAAPGNKVEAVVDGAVMGDDEADSSGSYKIIVDTQKLSVGSHRVQTRQLDFDSGITSDVSKAEDFRVVSFSFTNADFNDDNRVSVQDWSVFLNKYFSSLAEDRAVADLNGDGKTDLGDFSLFLVSFQLGRTL